MLPSLSFSKAARRAEAVWPPWMGRAPSGGRSGALSLRGGWAKANDAEKTPIITHEDLTNRNIVITLSS